MSDTRDYILPEASEKLSYKFILDELKEQSLKQPELQEVGTEPTPPETVCGTQATTDTTQLELSHIEPELEEKTLELQEEAATKEETGAETETDSVSSVHLDLPAGKKYFRIGEVSALVGVEPYVLRYWESEFSTIRPIKSTSGHRVYSRKDVETLGIIRQLLHVEKFSIKGAKKKLQERKKQVQVVQQVNHQALKDVSRELKELIQMIRATS